MLLLRALVRALAAAAVASVQRENMYMCACVPVQCSPAVQCSVPSPAPEPLCTMHAVVECSAVRHRAVQAAAKRMVCYSVHVQRCAGYAGCVYARTHARCAHAAVARARGTFTACGGHALPCTLQCATPGARLRATTIATHAHTQRHTYTHTHTHTRSHSHTHTHTHIQHSHCECTFEDTHTCT